jgi:hypothetical protein
MLAVEAEMTRADTDTLRESIKSALAKARRKAVTRGRSKGTGDMPEAVLANTRTWRNSCAKDSASGTGLPQPAGRCLWRGLNPRDCLHWLFERLPVCRPIITPLLPQPMPPPSTLLRR